MNNGIEYRANVPVIMYDIDLISFSDFSLPAIRITNSFIMFVKTKLIIKIFIKCL